MIQILPNTHNLIKTIIQDSIGGCLPHDAKCLGFSKNGEFGAGLAWHDMRYDDDGNCISVAFSWVIKNPQIMNKKIMQQFFDYPFNVLKVQRLWALIDVNNTQANILPKKLGATHEGVLRQVLCNGNDANIWSIVKDDLTTNKWWNKWLKAA